MSLNYFIIDSLQISQLKSGTGGVFTARLTFDQLYKIHRLTERKESLHDPFGLKKDKNDKIEDDEFQRHLSPGKLSEIKKYVGLEFANSDTKIIFPSAVIISLDLNEDNSEEMSQENIESLYSPLLQSCFVVNAGNSFKKIYIPKNNKISLIVDGQHRFYGFKKYYDTLDSGDKTKFEKFEFITTILVGFDSYQIAQVFANVNFHQKPVNRSLYYDIFGSTSTDRNEIQLAHFLALHMQNNIESPLLNMIKLLGKGYGLFSQAFFVEKLLIHFDQNGIWRDLYLDYKNNGERFLTISVFMKLYFSSVSYSYSSCWPEMVVRDGKYVYSSYAYQYILCKTTGMGAILRLINDIYPHTIGKSNEEIKIVLDSIFSRINRREAENFFSRNGEFGGAGSEGLQLKLYKKLKYKLNL